MPVVGRPEIGPSFSVRFPVGLVRDVDAAAARAGTSRAGWLRWAAEEQLAYPREVLSVLAAWMQDEGLAADIGYALEKPWKHTDFIFCAQYGIDGDQLDQLQETRREVLAGRLPDGWVAEETTPVDFRVICAHGNVVNDTEAERSDGQVLGCEHDCAPWVLAGSSEAGARVVSLRTERKDRRGGQQG